ncbi:MAG TPA: HNH endonuclease [Solirubrobacterales bacterium]|nr:HNH endonuclease [Solirubrobacterales bacterium]
MRRFSAHAIAIVALALTLGGTWCRRHTHRRLHVDHVIPVADGGSDRLGNLSRPASAATSPEVPA